MENQIICNCMKVSVADIEKALHSSQPKPKAEKKKAVKKTTTKKTTVKKTKKTTKKKTVKKA